MPELYQNRIPIIRRSLNDGFIRGDAPEVSFGCIERDYDVDPVMVGDSPAAMQLIDPSEYDARYEEREEQQSGLLHMFLRGDRPAFENLDQGQFPDCWAHSTAHCLMLNAMIQNIPIPRLNGVGAATLMNQLNGGWSGLSMKFAREKGYPVVGNGPGQWPYQSRNGRDTPELRAEMAKHKNLEDWYDLGRREWDQTLSDRQRATCLFNNMPMGADYNKYGHAMCAFDRVRISAGEWGDAVLNSWKGFGYFGVCIIPDSTAKPNNAVALRSGSISV